MEACASTSRLRDPGTVTMELKNGESDELIALEF